MNGDTLSTNVGTPSTIVDTRKTKGHTQRTIVDTQSISVGFPSTNAGTPHINDEILSINVGTPHTILNTQSFIVDTLKTNNQSLSGLRRQFNMAGRALDISNTVGAVKFHSTDLSNAERSHFARSAPAS